MLSLPYVEPSYFHGSVSKIACSPDKPMVEGEGEVDGMPGCERGAFASLVRLCFDEKNRQGEIEIHKLQAIRK